jgi:hypothetical protein
VELRPVASWRWGFEFHLCLWMSVCCECCVLSSGGLCYGLITRSERTYQVWLSLKVIKNNNKTQHLQQSSHTLVKRINKMYFTARSSQSIDIMIGEKLIKENVGGGNIYRCCRDTTRLLKEQRWYYKHEYIGFYYFSCCTVKCSSCLTQDCYSGSGEAVNPESMIILLRSDDYYSASQTNILLSQWRLLQRSDDYTP